MELNTSLPIYLQVVHAIETDIAAGRLKPGEKLPSGRELAVAWKINPNTAARVYQGLEAQGVCTTKRGLGTFVTGDEGARDRIRTEMARNLVGEFLRNMRELGYTDEEIRGRLKEEM